MMNRILRSLTAALAFSALLGCMPTTTEPPVSDTSDDNSATVRYVEPITPPEEVVAYSDEKTSLQFPLTLGGLTFVEHHGYPEPSMGFSVRYDDAETMKADIYVYDGGQSTIPSGHNNVLIQQELANAESGIRFYEQKGAYLDVTKLGEGTYPEDADTKTIAFVSSRFQYRQSEQFGVTFTGVRVSETYLRGFKDHFIKVRVTYPETEKDSSVQIRDDLLRQLTTVMQSAMD